MVSLYPWATWQEREGDCFSHVMERGEKAVLVLGWVAASGEFMIVSNRGLRKVAAGNNRQRRDQPVAEGLH